MLLCASLIAFRSEVSAFSRSMPFNWGSNFSNLILNHCDLVQKMMKPFKNENIKTQSLPIWWRGQEFLSTYCVVWIYSNAAYCLYVVSIIPPKGMVVQACFASKNLAVDSVDLTQSKVIINQLFTILYWHIN